MRGFCYWFFMLSAIIGGVIAICPAVGQVIPAPESGLSPKTTVTIADIIKKSTSLINAGSYDSAITLCRQGVLLCNNTGGDKLRLSTLNNYIGASFQFQGDFDSAVHYFYLAVDYAEAAKDGDAQLMEVYNNLSLTFNRTVDNEKALLYLEKADQIAKSKKRYTARSSILLNKGRIYKEMGKWQLSKETFLQALSLSSPEGNPGRVSPDTMMRMMLLTNLGQLHLAQQLIPEARKYLEEALPLSGNVNPYYQIPVRLGLGRVYLRLKQYELAEKHTLSAVHISETSEINDGLSEGHFLLATIYNAKGEAQKAFDHLSKAYQLEERIRSVDRTKDSRLLEVKYRTAQKDKEIAEKKLAVIGKDRLLKNKNIWIISISFGLLLLVIFLIIGYKNYHHNKRLQEQRMLSIEQDRRIEILKATAEGEERERTRIAGNLHDGIGSIISAAKMNFSTLHTLPSDRPVFEKSMKLLNEAAFELRTTAHNLMPQMLLQEGLVTATRDFCERVSNSQLLLIEYQAYGTFSPQEKNFELFVYRIIQELINNIIKHSGAQKALVQLSMSADLLAITIEDNGRGMQAEDWNKGAGLKNIENKVHMLRGLITVESTQQRGTQVYLEFDLTQTQITL